MIDGITNADALPVLEQLMRFAGERHRLITHNIANLSTPDFRPVDLSVDAFQETLQEAVDERRERAGSVGGELRMGDDGGANGTASALQARPAGYNLLFHDGNDRDLERTMQDLVENFMVFRTAAQFLRSRFDLINTAIRERL
jgi:flagellar basal-body rod protein FlgB